MLLASHQRKRNLRSFIMRIRSRKHVAFFFSLFLLVIMCETANLVRLAHKTVALETMNHAPAAVGIFGHIFKMKGRAEKWALWHANDQTTSALSRADISCEWTAFKPFGNPENTAHMCTYPEATDRYVSGMIKDIGRWDECDGLVGLWKEATEKQGAFLTSLKTAIYLDVGGNIGSCVMEMLQSTDAKIVVFEPHPHNLAQITTTIMGQPEQVRKRVIIFPVGVGDVTSNFAMHMNAVNRGYSVVGADLQATVENPSLTFSDSYFLSAVPIFVERLDDIFNMDEVVIPLLKIDIEGFECKALDGMASLLSTVDSIKTELIGPHLERQGCTVEGLTSRITNAGFHVVVDGQNMIASRK